jgi:hypothetical protein
MLSQVASKRFMQNTRWFPFQKFKNNVHRPNTEALPMINTTFNPP